MCKLCDENGGEMQSCQLCGVLVCFDNEMRDDISDRAFVTSSGDLMCLRCGREWEEEEEREADAGEYFPDPMEGTQCSPQPEAGG